MAHGRALIRLNDMTSLPRDPVFMRVTPPVGKTAAERFPACALDHELQGIRP
jgi:hypothetical protein